MNTQNRLMHAFRFGALAVVLALAGCGGGGGGSGTSSPTINLGITDAPIDSAEAVVIEFTDVEIQPETGDRLMFTLAAPKQIDLTTLTNGKTEMLLDDQELPAGTYSWIRLYVNMANSYIQVNGAQHPLTIPSNEQTGLKLNRPFTLTLGGVANFVIDFDLRKSITVTGNSDYKLRPTLRIVDATVSGRITGTVDPTLLADASCTGGDAVYVYQGAGVIPDDVDGIEPDPVASALVEMDQGGQYVYTVPFLDAGDYTVAFTCQAAADDPALDDVIAFVGATDVTVLDNTVTTHDFMPEVAPGPVI